MVADIDSHANPSFASSSANLCRGSFLGRLNEQGSSENEPDSIFSKGSKQITHPKDKQNIDFFVSRRTEPQEGPVSTELDSTSMFC